MAANRRKLGAVLATAIAVAALFLVGGTPASAHFARSSISLGVDDHTAKGHQKIIFFGKLKNSHKKCRKDQKVALVRKGTGVVQTDTTDGEGEFFFRHDPKPNHGKFFARYRGRGKFGYANKHSCSKAVSDKIRIRRG